MIQVINIDKYFRENQLVTSHMRINLYEIHTYF